MKLLTLTGVCAVLALLTLSGCDKSNTARLEATIAAQSTVLAAMVATSQAATSTPTTVAPTSTPTVLPTDTPTSTPVPIPTDTPPPLPTATRVPQPTATPFPPTATPYIVRSYPERQADGSTAEVFEWSNGRFTKQLITTPQPPTTDGAKLPEPSGQPSIVTPAAPAGPDFPPPAMAPTASPPPQPTRGESEAEIRARCWQQWRYAIDQAKVMGRLMTPSCCLPRDLVAEASSVIGRWLGPLACAW